MKINFFGMLFEMIKTLFFMFLKLLIPVFICIGIIVLIFVFYLLYFRVVKKIKPKKSYLVKVPEDNFIVKLFYKFPKQLAYDILTQDVNTFDQFGIHMFCGSQRCGKSMTMVYLMDKFQHKYPKLKIFTNMEYVNENASIDSWQDMIKIKNGTDGIVFAFDEMQSWFPSRDWNKIPAALIGEISQLSKQRKAVFGSAQVFKDLTPQFRNQTYQVYLPRTYFGCLTVVFLADPKSYDTDKNVFKKTKFGFFFIQTPELRAMYDSYKRVDRYADLDFSNSTDAGVLSTCSEDHA